jgi:DNA invertase Pin-like site-specific DNA recombinase
MLTLDGTSAKASPWPNNAAHTAEGKRPSPEQADELVRRAAAGTPKTTLARDYGISRETVYQYLRQTLPAALAAAAMEPSAPSEK